MAEGGHSTHNKCEDVFGEQIHTREDQLLRKVQIMRMFTMSQDQQFVNCFSFFERFLIRSPIGP